MAKKFSAEEIDAAAKRCKARGISTLYPSVFEAAMREELGTTVEEQEEHEAEARAAAELRLARGEAALHAARRAAARRAAEVAS